MRLWRSMADDLHTLSAPYALDALSRDDRERFEEHLATCGRCRDELAGLQDAAASLAFAVEGPVPPAALRGRILAAAHEEPANVVPLRRRRSVWLPVAATIAVAASVAAVGFGIWAATLHHSLSREQVAVRVLGDPASRRIPISGKGTLVVDPTGTAVLALRLPALPSGKTYEAWVADPSVQRAGEFAGRTTTLPLRVSRGARVMVTIERAGGVDAPTSQPLFVAHV
jgi:anti-sigma factor RsiW